jgi:glucosamine--fructose-6-phosphate aminotransferase (isomerizing)
MAAIELAKEKGATIFGICNVVGSSIPRLTHANMARNIFIGSKIF